MIIIAIRHLNQPSNSHQLLHIRSSKVARIKHIAHLIILLLQRPGRRKPLQQTRATRLVTSATCSATTETLLANNSSSGLAVDVEIAGSVPQLVLSLSDSFLIV